jgi:rhodanese-related sulfurtransferase
MNEIPRDRPVYIMCQSGVRSYIAARILMGHDIDCYNFSGGYRFYSAVKDDTCMVESATMCGMDKN